MSNPMFLESEPEPGGFKAALSTLRWKATPDLKGVFSPRGVRLAAFVVVSLCLLAASAMCILAVWDYVGQDSAWRMLATMGIVVAATAAFTALNEAFGAMLG
jgi:hypothetical protein